MTNKRLVAIVDSNPSHLLKVSKILLSFYNLVVYETGEEALQKIPEDNPAIVVASPEIKPHGSVDFIRALREKYARSGLPIIYIAESEMDDNLKKAQEAGINASLIKPYAPSALIRTITKQIGENIEKEWEALPEPQQTALKQSAGVFKDLSDVIITGESMSFHDVKDNCQSLVDVVESNNFKDILDGVKNHDDYTYAHSMRVATLLTLLGHAAGFKNDDQLIMSSGGLLHDVGKMMIPHNILNKPGKLTEEEFEIMKSHVPETMEYLERTGNIPKGVKIIAEQHHEKIDGTGYPNGLKGKELNELARMAAIVDVFSALTDRRVYKDPMEAPKAFSILEEMTNHLDQHYVKMFRTVLIDAEILT